MIHERRLDAEFSLPLEVITPRVLTARFEEVPELMAKMTEIFESQEAVAQKKLMRDRLTLSANLVKDLEDMGDKVDEIVDFTRIDDEIELNFMCNVMSEGIWNYLTKGTNLVAAIGNAMDVELLINIMKQEEAYLVRELSKAMLPPMPDFSEMMSGIPVGISIFGGIGGADSIASMLMQILSSDEEDDKAAKDEEN